MEVICELKHPKSVLRVKIPECHPEAEYPDEVHIRALRKNSARNAKDEQKCAVEKEVAPNPNKASDLNLTLSAVGQLTDELTIGTIKKRRTHALEN